MPLDRIEQALAAKLETLAQSGTRKGHENVITGVRPAQGGHGPRYLLDGEGEREFLRMNSNSYLGMALREEVIAAEERAARSFGAGPGAVRFISGTFAPHVDLEARLAAFHGRAAGMLFSSAYAAVMGVLPALVSDETAVISDALNHNCIINATRLAKPAEKLVYNHLDMRNLEDCLERAAQHCRRVLIVTDGVFSMRGDHAPLSEIKALAQRWDSRFAENVLVLVDDSHGVGALGTTGRGTEEHAGAQADLLIATLGKALGVNGGYVVSSRTAVDFLREQAAFYIYSNPITPGEAAAALQALAILDSDEGLRLLEHLRRLAARFREGLTRIGFETIAGKHPVVPLLVRDTERTHALVRHLYDNGILATGLAYPVVPRGDEEIRFQIAADHTDADVDKVLDVLAKVSG